MVDTGSAAIEMFQAFIEVLHAHRVAYCLVSGFEDYPQKIESDVDFIIDPARVGELSTLMREVAERAGCRLVQAIHHESGACYFALVKREETRLAFLHPDASADYRRNGRLWLSSSELLARRRMHPNGFYVPASEDAFIYYAIKRIDKRSLTDVHGHRLSRWYSEAPQACREALRGLWSAPSCRELEQALKADQWDRIRGMLGDLAAELQLAPRKEGPLGRVWQGLRDLWRLVGRVAAPTGLFVVFVGPDGCGKSTVIEQVHQALAPAFRGTYTFHLRPRFGQRPGAGTAVTAPHDAPPRGAIFSAAKLAYFVVDFALGYWLSIRRRLIQSTLVIGDRYYHDLLIDPKRFRFGLPLWMARAAAHFVPKPDVWILLDAPAEVLQARKQEVPFEETRRQRAAFQALIGGMRNGMIVNAARPVDDVVGDVVDRLLAHMEERTLRRLSQPSAYGG